MQFNYLEHENFHCKSKTVLYIGRELLIIREETEGAYKITNKTFSQRNTP